MGRRETLIGRDYQGDLDVDGRIILKWMLHRIGWNVLD
jgi:hypothetical protein